MAGLTDLPLWEIVNRLGGRDCASFAQVCRWTWAGGDTLALAEQKRRREMTERAWAKSKEIYDRLQRIYHILPEQILGVGENAFIDVVSHVLGKPLCRLEPDKNWDKIDWAVYHTMWNYITEGQQIEPTDDQPHYRNVVGIFLVFYGMEIDDLRTIGW